MNKVTPITLRAKGSPFKIADTLVQGAKEMYATKKTGFEGGKAVKNALPKANNQASNTVPGLDGTIVDNDDGEKKSTDKKIKEKTNINDIQVNSGMLPESTLGTVGLIL